MSMQPEGPKTISGDLNASLCRLPSIDNDIKSGVLFDLGACASRFGGTDNENTCSANLFAKASRRDYAIVDRAAFDLVDNFVVNHNLGFPVRSALCSTFTQSAERDPYVAIKLPRTINDIFYNIERAKNNRVNKLEECKQFMCEVAIPLM